MSNTVRVVSGANRNTGSIVVKKGGDLTVQGLSNVVSTDLQDGYTLVYDAAQNKWVAQQVSGETIQSVDGGTY